MPPKKSNNNSQKTRSQIFSSPFNHLVVQNFLSPDVYKKTFEIYNKLQFKQKSTDLFNFFQTNQLNQYEKLNFFKDELDKQFWQLQPMTSGKIKKQNTFYSIFASYYFAGDYLLCHDDVIQDRKYAFSYYLQDHDSGDLVFFNKDANKQVKRIKVRKNTLAIFEVSDISYHEVDYTKTDGRKAITGWFNIKGLSSTRVQKTIPKYIPFLPNSQDSLDFPLQPQHFSEEYFQLMDIQYQFNIKKTSLQGPFFSRRVHKIQISPTVIFTLPGYKLYSVQFYSFQKGDYILLNDPINTIENQDIIDIFVTNLPDDFPRNQPAEDQEQQQDDMLVKIVQQGDEQTNGIPEIHDSLFVVHRGKKQYYVDRCQKQFKLGHFIYVKDDGNNKSKSKNKKNKTIVPENLQLNDNKKQVIQPKKGKKIPKQNQTKSNNTNGNKKQQVSKNKNSKKQQYKVVKSSTKSKSSKPLNKSNKTIKIKKQNK